MPTLGRYPIPITNNKPCKCQNQATNVKQQTHVEPKAIILAIILEAAIS